ncbi:hypothetical protein [Corynebacterium sp. zg331]|uniref:hypothetical protein n=1 Tax=unclassified Corynebacterium TaxID=2624378 RepID=UPI00351AF8D7
MLFVLGLAGLIGGFFWAAAAGHSVVAILAALVIGVGGSLITTAWAMIADKISPTSKKL